MPQPGARAADLTVIKILRGELCTEDRAEVLWHRHYAREDPRDNAARLTNGGGERIDSHDHAQARLVVGNRGFIQNDNHQGCCRGINRPEQLAASFSSAAVKQEQRIRFDCLRHFASPQFAFRRFDRCPDPLPRVVG